MTPEELIHIEQVLLCHRPFFIFEEFHNETHRVWVENIKNQNLPPLSKPPCEITPIFLPVIDMVEPIFIGEAIDYER
jgi:hypothetical protein